MPHLFGSFEYVDDHQRLNKCGVISPRFDIGVKQIDVFVWWLLLTYLLHK